MPQSKSAEALQRWTITQEAAPGLLSLPFPDPAELRAQVQVLGTKGNLLGKLPTLDCVSRFE